MFIVYTIHQIQLRVIKSRRLKWAGNVARIEESTGAFKILTGKSKRKRFLRGPMGKWEDNIRIYLKEMCHYEELV